MFIYVNFSIEIRKRVVNKNKKRIWFLWLLTTNYVKITEPFPSRVTSTFSLKQLPVRNLRYDTVTKIDPCSTALENISKIWLYVGSTDRMSIIKQFVQKFSFSSNIPKMFLIQFEFTVTEDMYKVFIFEINYQW